MADTPEQKTELPLSLRQNEKVRKILSEAGAYLLGQYGDAARSVGELGGVISGLTNGKAPAHEDHDHDHHDHEHHDHEGEEHHDHEEHEDHDHHDHEHHAGEHHSHSIGTSYANITAASALLSAGVFASEKLPIPKPLKILLNVAASIPLLNGVLRPQLTHALAEKRPDEIARHGLTTTLLAAGMLSGNHEWATSGAMLGFLNAVAGEMEGKFHERQSEAIEKLRDNIPEFVSRRNPDGSQEKIKLSDVKIGDVVIVSMGGFVPVDGTVVKGESQVNTNFYSGRDLPEHISGKDAEASRRICQGAIALDGMLEVRVDEKPEHSMVSELLNNVENAPSSSHQTKIGGIIDKYTYLLLGATALQFAISALKGRKAGGLNLGGAMEDSLELAIKASPCTLMTAPLVYPFLSKRLASEHGILVNNQRGLENTSDIDVVLTDLTGTLTEGRPEVMGMFSYDKTGKKIGNNELLCAAASAEQKSVHPLAKSIVEYASKKNLELQITTNDKEVVAKGVTCTINGEEVAAGKELLIKEGLAKGESIPQALLDKADEERAKGYSVVFVRQGNTFGVISLDDPLREGAKETIANLHSRNIIVELLTGDHPIRAQRIADALGIKTFHADCKPETKADIVRKYQAEGMRVAMVGDGVNDSLAMQIAQGAAESGQKEGVAFAIKGSAAITETTASIALESINQLPGLLDVSERVERIAKRNGTAAAAWTALLAGSHLFGIKVGPLAASFMHEVPSFGMVAMNSKLAEQISSSFSATLPVDSEISPPRPTPAVEPKTPHERPRERS